MSLHQPPEFLPTPGKPAIPWTQWHRLFKNYLLASGSDAHPPARRKALLLHCLGVEGQRLYYALPEEKSSTPPTEGKEGSGTSDEYDAAVATLDACFTSKTNVVVERHRFGQRTQLPGETATAFVTALRELALSCDFAYQSFNESSHQFLQTQGLSSSGPASQLMFKLCLAVWCGLVGAFFTFPGLRYARMHWDSFKYCEGQHLLRLLLHLSFVSPLFVVLLWVKPLAREYFTQRSFPGMRGNLMSGEAFETSRIVLVLAVVAVRLCLMPRYLQSYLNLAPERMADMRREAGNITNIDLQRRVVRVFYYLCVVALQYITPLLACAFTALLLKTLGGHSWGAYLWSSSGPGTMPIPQGVPTKGSAPSPESILATSQQLSLTLAGLRAVFTPMLFRGLLSFMTWWLCATSFATSVVGLVYQSYTSTS
ncbi:transmembrane protein 161-like emei isoform X5 [Amblyomma americanum]